jgi:histidyl-tRNA synthetase
MMLTNIKPKENDGPIFIANFDEKLMPIYQKIAYELRKKELNVEVYYGDKKGLKQQLAYADKKNCPIAIFLGEDEFNKGVVSLRNLKLGKFLADKVTDKKEWTAQVQCEVPKNDVVAEVLIMLI